MAPREARRTSRSRTDPSQPSWVRPASGLAGRGEVTSKRRISLSPIKTGEYAEDATMSFIHKTLACLAAALLSSVAWSDTQDCRSVLDGVLGNANRIQVTVAALNINGSLGSIEGVLVKTVPGNAAGKYRLS